MSQDYHEAQRAFQDRFDTRRPTDRLAEATIQSITLRQKSFIEGREMFFLATADDEGWPECGQLRPRFRNSRNPSATEGLRLGGD